jgi:hypothetical protein
VAARARNLPAMPRRRPRRSPAAYLTKQYIDVVLRWPGSKFLVWFPLWTFVKP